MGRDWTTLNLKVKSAGLWSLKAKSWFCCASVSTLYSGTPIVPAEQGCQEGSVS